MTQSTDLHILYMEDDPGIARLVQKRLTRGGFTVDIARDGIEGMAMYETGLYDIIAVDQNMPGYAGLDVIRLMIAQGPLPPIIMVTGTGSEQIAVEAMKLGAMDYLVKDVEGTYLDLLPLVITRAVRQEQLIREKRLAEIELRQSYALLEERVQERTIELARANQALQAEIAERKRAEEQSQRQLRQITALREIDIAISTSLDLRLTLSILLDQVATHLQIDAAAILLLDMPTNTLTYVVERGLHSSRRHNVSLSPGEGWAGRILMEQSMLYIPDIQQATDIAPYHDFVEQEELCAYFGIPLVARRQVKGVLELYHRTTLSPDQEWFDFLEALAGQAAIAIDSTEMFEHLQHTHNELILAYDATIEGWARALELRDADTEGHTRRVAHLTLKLAHHMDVSETELTHMRRGAILHDIGKLAIPDSILLKTGPLTPEEWEIMRRHPLYAAQLLAPIPFLRPAMAIPLYHHEKWDGSGYPYGLSGEGIPFAARIFAVVDVWDALCSNRPYHRAWPPDQVREHIRIEAGSHFDPQVVDVFLSMLARQ